MKKKRIRLISIVLALVVSISSLSVPTVVMATESIKEGTCGDNLRWVLDERGVMTISGTGEMYDFDYGKAPWYYFRDEINSLIAQEGITSIGNLAFYACSSLTNIELPESITSLGVGAFYNCTSLTSIKLPKGITSVGGSAFYACSSLTNIELPESITSLDDYTFYACTSLTNVELPKSITSIGDHVFRFCGSLTSIELPESIASIGNYAFQYCGSLTSIELPEGIASIGNYVFQFCHSLTSIELPETIISIGYAAFGDSCKVADIYYLGTLEQWRNITIAPGNEGLQGALLHLGGTIAATFGDNLIWALDENGVMTISGTGAMHDYEGGPKPWFNEVNLLIVQEGVTSIGSGIFSYCSSLTNIELPESITSIGGSAFGNCTSLTSIKLSKGITSVGNYAFSYCSSLTNIELPESITSLGVGAFTDCTSLTSIKLPKGITSIGESAFDGCTSLTSIELPENITSIGRGSFSNCSALADVYYLGTLEQWRNIIIIEGNEYLRNATIHYESSMPEETPMPTEKPTPSPTSTPAPTESPTPSPTAAPTVAPTETPVDTPDEDYTGIYWTEEDGKAVGYYYVEGSVKKGAGIVQIGDYLYYVLTSGKIAAGENKTVSESRTNGLIDAGTYYFYKNGVLETEEVRLSGEIRWTEENGKQVGYYYVMNEIRKDVGLVELYNEEAGEPCWYYVLYSGKVKKNNVADGKRVNQTVKANKVNKYTGPAGTYSFYEDGVMYDPYATESGIVKYDATGKPYYYVDGHIRKDAGLIYVQRGDLAGNYIFVTYSGTLKKGTQTVKESKCNGHTEFVGTRKFDDTTGAMIVK